MKVISICGSRNRSGQTATAIAAIIRGVEKAGGSAEQVFLPELNLLHCQQCGDSGWGLCHDEGRCVIDDDFAALVEKIRQADGLIAASPVYYSDMSESMRTFSDRLRRICMQTDGRTSMEGKPTIVLCAGGGQNGGAVACCASVGRVMTLCGLDVVEAFPVCKQNLTARLPRLELAGQWFATAPQSSE